MRDEAARKLWPVTLRGGPPSTRNRASSSSLRIAGFHLGVSFLATMGRDCGVLPTARFDEFTARAVAALASRADGEHISPLAFVGERCERV